MKFKNAVVYGFVSAPELSVQQANDCLKKKAFKALKDDHRVSVGFVPPFPHDEEKTADLEHLYHLNGRWYFSIRTDERVIKPAHVARKLRERVEKIEELEARSVQAKEREQLKAEVVKEMIPSTVPDTSYDVGFISPAQGLLVIEASSFVVAEKVASLLRSAFESLPIKTIEPQKSVVSVLTEWVKERRLQDIREVFDKPDIAKDMLQRDEYLMASLTDLAVCPFDIGEKAEFRATGEHGEEKLKIDSAYPAERISVEYLNNGYWVESLALELVEPATTSFYLPRDLILKSIKFGPELAEKAGEWVDDKNVDFEENVAGLHWDANAILVADLIEQIWSTLIESFGGYETPPATW